MNENFWEQAPLVDQPANKPAKNFWDDAPIAVDGIDAAPVAQAQPEPSGMLSGMGSGIIRGYQDTRIQSGIAEKFRLQEYKTSLENGGAIDENIEFEPFKQTPAQLELNMRGVPKTDPVWRAAEIARVTNEMGKLDQSIKESAATIQNYPEKSAAYTALQADIETAKKEGRPISGTFGALFNNPKGVVEFAAESIPGMAKPIVGAIGASVALRRGQAAPVVQKLGPIATSMGLTGVDAYKGMVTELIEKKANEGGINLRNNPEAMGSLLQDANFIEAVKSDAFKAGMSDGAWAGISIALGMSPKIKGFWQPLVQSVVEGAGSVSKDVTLNRPVDTSGAIMASTLGGVIEGPSYGIAKAAGAFGKATPPPAAPGPQAQQAPAPTPVAPQPIDVDDLLSVAGETVEAPAAPAPVAAVQPELPVQPAAQPPAVAPAPAPVAPAQPAPVAVQPQPTPAPAPQPVATAQPEAKPVAPVAPAAQAEIPGTAETFNLTGEQVATPAPKAVDTTAEMPLEGARENPLATEARARLGKLEAAGKGDSDQAKALRRTIERESKSAQPVAPVAQAEAPAVEPTADLKQGDRFTDAEGKTWQVWDSRFGMVKAFPVVDGKISVNNKDGVRFATNELARLRNPEARTDVNPVKPVAQAQPAPATEVSPAQARYKKRLQALENSKALAEREAKLVRELQEIRAREAQPNPRTDAEIKPVQSPQAEAAPVAEAGYVVRIGKREYKVGSLAEASKKWMDVQEEIDNQGMSWNRSQEFADIPNPTIYDSSGKQIGWISQNGTIADGVPGKPKNKLFDPYAEPVAEAAPVEQPKADPVQFDKDTSEGQPRITEAHTVTKEVMAKPIRIYRGIAKADGKPSSNAMHGPGYYYSFEPQTAKRYAAVRGEGATVEYGFADLSGKTLLNLEEIDRSTPQFKSLVNALGLPEDAGARQIYNKVKALYPTDGMFPAAKLGELAKKAGYDGIVSNVGESGDIPAHSQVMLFDRPELSLNDTKAPEPVAEQPKQEAKPAEEATAAEPTAEASPTQADLEGINDQLAEMERNKQGDSPEAEALRTKRDAVQAKLDEATIGNPQIESVIDKGNPTKESLIAAMDKAAKEALDPTRLNEGLSSFPKLAAALTWATAREIQKGLTDFAKWSAEKARKHPLLKGSLKSIWERAQLIAKHPLDYFMFRALDNKASKVWQNVARNPQSPTLRKLANIVFAKGGPDADAVDNGIPTRIDLAIRQYENFYAGIMEPFAREFADMSNDQRKQWDADFIAMVEGDKEAPDAKTAKAVADFRRLMQRMLGYQIEAGATVGDQGEFYFPRQNDVDAVDADRSGFIKVAEEMYRRQEKRLLDKAIKDVREQQQTRPDERKAADEKAVKEGKPGRKVKPDAEYKQEAAEWAQEKIDALESEHAAKDDEYYKEKAEAWATATTDGDVIGLTLFKNTEGKVRADSMDSRSFTKDEAKLADAYRSKDLDTIVAGYIHGAVRAAELARTFGEDGKKFEQMMNDLREEKVDKEVIKETRELVAEALGVGPGSLSQAQAAFFDVVNIVMAGAYLGGSFLYNLILEPIMFGSRRGTVFDSLRGVTYTWLGTAKEILNASPEVREQIVKKFGSSAVFEKTAVEAVTEQLGLVSRELSKAYLGSHWDTVSDKKGMKWAKWITNRIYRANLMNATEKAKTIASVRLSRLVLRDNARFMLGQSPLQKLFGGVGLDTSADASSAAIMRENGVPEADHKAFAKWVMELDGKTDAEWQNAVMDPKDPMAKHYRRALQRVSISLSVKTNSALKISGADGVWGRLLMQLMNYSYAAASLIKDRMYAMLKEAIVRKDINAIDRIRYAAPAAVGIPIGIIGAAAVTTMAGMLFKSDERDEAEKKRSWWRKMFNWSSLAGVVPGGPKVEMLVKNFERKQAAGGVTLDTIFKTAGAAFSSANDPDNEKKWYDFKKQALNVTGKPGLVGLASGVHPFFGFMANAYVKQDAFREAVIGEKPKKK